MFSPSSLSAACMQCLGKPLQCRKQVFIALFFRTDFANLFRTKPNRPFCQCTYVCIKLSRVVTPSYYSTIQRRQQHTLLSSSLLLLDVKCFTPFPLFLSVSLSLQTPGDQYHFSSTTTQSHTHSRDAWLDHPLIVKVLLCLMGTFYDGAATE